MVAIVRLRDSAAMVRLAQALVDGGICSLEFTMTTPGALDAIAACKEQFGNDVAVGAGTVLDANAAALAIQAGAQFLVSPGFDAGVVAAGRNGGAVAMPGAMTPTEILAAWRAGADIIKVFPARSLGPRYISDVLAPLPDVPLMPTGGIDETNAADFLRAGAVGLGVGGKLVDAAAVAREDWEAIRERARRLMAAVHSVTEAAG